MMFLISSVNYISCRFTGEKNNALDGSPVPVTLYYANTKDILGEYQLMRKYISVDEQIRADKLHFQDDRTTWLFCHVLIRCVIAQKLDKDPSEIIITIDKNNKPWLTGDRLFFNISHTREAFSFAISDKRNIGVDLENIDRKVDFRSIIKTFFSSGEIKFILDDPNLARERFFLLWTRKEALLKAVGTGIIEKLQDIEVFRDENILKRGSFDNFIDNRFFCDYFIYSIQMMNNFMSVAVPCKAKIIMHHLDAQNVNALLQDKTYR